MLFYHYKNIINYNILNKFKLKCLNNLPRIKRISLSFVYSNFNFKELVKTILISELILSQKISLKSAYNAKIALKVKNGFVNNCKIILIKKFIFRFVENIFYKVFFSNSNYSSTFFKDKYFCTVKLKNLNCFTELKKRHSLVENSLVLKLDLLVNTKEVSRLFFFVKSLRLPI